MNRVVVLLVPLLVGCVEARAASGAQVQKGLRKWAPAPTTVEYTRVNFVGPLPLPDVPLRDDWAGPTEQDGRLVYDVTSWEILPDSIPTTVERASVFYGPEGYGYLGTWDQDGVYATWDPPQIVLPPKPRVGATWSATHTKGDVVSERSCEIMASNLCDGGLTSVCESVRAEGRIILRDHFCPNVGWSGFEAMVLVGERPPVRMWSEHVVRDGRALPEPPQEEAEEPPLVPTGPDAPPQPAGPEAPTP